MLASCARVREVIMLTDDDHLLERPGADPPPPRAADRPAADPADARRSHAAQRHRRAAGLLLEALSEALGADPGLVASRAGDGGFALRLSILPTEDHLARAEALANAAILGRRRRGADGEGSSAGGLGMVVVTRVAAEADGTVLVEGASGPEALAWLKGRSRLLARAAGALRCAPEEAPGRVAELLAEIRALGARLAEARRRLAKLRPRPSGRTKKVRRPS
jgi:hypothetical protein